MKRSPLDSLRVVSPCPVPWSSMNGDDRVRLCGKCRKNVCDVAAMTETEALEVIERAEGRVCMQLTIRPDGTIATGDCWAALRRARRRGLLALAVALPAILLAQLWSQAFGLRALYGFFRSQPALMTMRGEPTIINRERPVVAPPPRPERVIKGRVALPDDESLGGL